MGRFLVLLGAVLGLVSLTLGVNQHRRIRALPGLTEDERRSMRDSRLRVDALTSRYAECAVRIERLREAGLQDPRVVGRSRFFGRLTPEARIEALEEAMKIDYRPNGIRLRDQLFEARGHLETIHRLNADPEEVAEAFLALAWSGEAGVFLFGLEDEWLLALGRSRDEEQDLALMIAALHLSPEGFVLETVLELSRAHAYDRVRENALHALGEWESRDPRIEDALNAGLLDPAERVRERAREMLIERAGS